MTPPPPPLPDGVSFGTAPGGVRVINIRFDEDEWETRWAKVPHATLRRPETRAAVTLIGTAHISKKSVEEVRETIEAVQPDTVCVELCETRYQAMNDVDRWRKLDIFQVIRQKMQIRAAQMVT